MKRYAIIAGIPGHESFVFTRGGDVACVCGEFRGPRGKLGAHVERERIVARLVERQRAVFADLAELDKLAPDAVDAITATMAAHLRSWRPASVAPLGTLPAPEASSADPREAARQCA